MNYPIDNISEDTNGDLYLATLPKLISGLAGFDDPLNAPTPPATVWKVTRLNREVADKYEYSLSKVIEDRDGEVLPGTTTAIHDALTGRLFLSGKDMIFARSYDFWLIILCPAGVIAPFVTVCDPA